MTYLDRMVRGVVGVVSGLTTLAPSVVTVHDIALASAVSDWVGDFFKSDHGPIPPCARWIAVHPNGEGTKGVPILVEPVKDGSGQMRVIAGAGGKLNMLKLRGVRSPAEYREGHGERATAERNRMKEQTRRDKELGLHDAKVLARKNLNGQRKSAQVDFIKTVAEAMGWAPGALHPQTTYMSAELEKNWTQAGMVDHIPP